jgi:cyclase
MLKKRIIPVLLLKNGFLVQSKGFRRFQNIGNPVSAVARLSEWGADELIYLDISRSCEHDMRRDDLGHANRDNIWDILLDVAGVTFMPVTVGGNVRSMQDILQRLQFGADKVAVNTILQTDPQLVSSAAREFGSQCIVASIDVKSTSDGPRAFVSRGSENTGCRPLEWARRAEDLGAGEILLNSIDRDGMRTGYDLDLLSEVSDGVSVPVIAQGGVGEWSHMAQALEQTSVSAVAAANIFHYYDQSVYLAKEYLFDRGFPVRAPALHTFDYQTGSSHD